MKAKLIKYDYGYGLGDCELIAFVSKNRPTHKHYKLSLKNCQAIERGYDLDELAIGYFKQIHMGFGIIEAYKKGFQEALEVNADKRFTLKEMVDCWNRALEFQTHKETLGEYIKSLQQIGWDVEIEMECPKTGCDIECDIDCYEPNKKPKLDSDGCLILKKL